MAHTAPSVEQRADKTDQLKTDHERIAELERTVTELQQENAALRERVAELEANVDDHDEQLQDHNDWIEMVDTFADALSNRVDSTIDRIAELQAHELEKGAHLDWENVDGIEDRIVVNGSRVERFIDKEGQQWARLPGEANPLNRSEPTQLAIGDLLLIRQLARMDDDMLRSSTPSLPAQLAAKVWRTCENDSHTTSLGK
jgi:hypothetical protein